MLLTLLSLYNVLFLSLITNIVWKPILSCYALAFKILEIYGFVRMFCKPLWTSHYSDFCLVSYLPPLSSTTSGSHKLKTLACNCIWQMPSGKRGFALALQVRSHIDSCLASGWDLPGNYYHIGQMITVLWEWGIERVPASILLLLVVASLHWECGLFSWLTYRWKARGETKSSSNAPNSLFLVRIQPFFLNKC